MKLSLRLLVLAGAIAWTGPIQAQQFDNFGRERARQMLRNITEDIKKHYYDPTFHGVDFDARVREADEKLRHATSVTESFKTIAVALQSLNDFHTYFIPPLQHFTVEYGWQMQMIGNHCYVTHVQPKSDAETKGLKPGDEIISVNGVATDRDGLIVLGYILSTLSPQPELHLEARSAGAEKRQLVVAAKVEPIKMFSANVMAEAQTSILKASKIIRKNLPNCQALGANAGVCKIPAFEFEDQDVRELLRFAQKYPALILDLRTDRFGNSGALEGLLGGFFDHDIKVGDRVTRGGTKAEVIKPQKDHFSGKVVVLIDSESRSVAELFARTMQLQKRATVLGDRSAGLVRESKHYEYHLPQETLFDSYYAMITDAEVVMADGQSLERKGVMPDETLLPTPEDLASGNDPALAHAADLLGVKITPEQAGKLFPFEWPQY